MIRPAEAGRSRPGRRHAAPVSSNGAILAVASFKGCGGRGNGSRRRVDASRRDAPVPYTPRRSEVDRASAVLHRFRSGHPSTPCGEWRSSGQVSGRDTLRRTFMGWAPPRCAMTGARCASSGRSDDPCEAVRRSCRARRRGRQPIAHARPRESASGQRTRLGTDLMRGLGAVPRVALRPGSCAASSRPTPQRPLAQRPARGEAVRSGRTWAASWNLARAPQRASLPGQGRPPRSRSTSRRHWRRHSRGAHRTR